MTSEEFRSILRESIETGKSFADVAKSREGAKKQRSRPRHEEHDIQVMCVEWFRAAYPDNRLDLFAIGNGGRRDAVTGAMLKREGVTAGVADLCLAIPRHGFGCLFVEMKTRTGKQEESQIAFERSTTRAGNKYVVCRSLTEFRETINDYMQ